MKKKKIVKAYCYEMECKNCGEILPNYGYTFEHSVTCPKCNFSNWVLKDIEYVLEDGMPVKADFPKYDIIALTGKSGSGKDTILREFIKNHFNNIHPITQATTRPRRSPSEPGYLFYDDKEWIALEKQEAFLESTTFNNWHYGTLISSLTSKIGKWNIGIFSPAAIEQLRTNLKVNKLKVFEICADDKIRMKRSLNREDSPDVSEICRRMLADEKDFKALSPLLDIRLLDNNNLGDIDKCVNTILRYTTGQERE